MTRDALRRLVHKATDLICRVAKRVSNRIVFKFGGRRGREGQERGLTDGEVNHGDYDSMEGGVRW